MAAFLYEGVLLFGVLMGAGLIYGTVTQQRHALEGRLGLQLFVLLVLAAYFVWFWSHGGQTLAMKTWRLKVICADGGPLSQARALWRFVLSWTWFAPAWIAVYLAGLKSGQAIAVTALVGVLAYAATSRLHPERQFLHDVLAGTRIVEAPLVPKPL